MPGLTKSEGFGLNASKNIGSDEVATIFGADTCFKGTLTFEKPVRIDGKFEGDISTKAFLYIGKSAHVKGEVSVGNIAVEGTVEGNIRANELVELRSTANVSGDITSARLTVADGASFVGRSAVDASGALSRTAPGDISARKGAAPVPNSASTKRATN
ncbi:polymer-forming cytoskeletal protein [Candidatus Hydrogenedentota bacterium]